MNTINEYYKPLHIIYALDTAFINKNKQADLIKYNANKDKLDALKPYFSEHLYPIWDRFFRYKNAPLGKSYHVDKPRLSAFIGFGLMDEMFLNIQFYTDTVASQRELFLMQHIELFEAIIKETDDGWNYDFNQGAGWYKGDNPLYGSDDVTGNMTKSLNEKYYDIMINEIRE